MAVAAPVTGLLCLFRADSVTGVTSGNRIISWADSAGGRTLVQRNGTLPQYVTSGAGGQPRLRFDRASDMQMAGPPVVPQPFTLVAIASVVTSDTTANKQIIWQGAGGELATDATTQRWYNYAGAGRTAASPAASTSPQVITSVFNGAAGDSAMYINGTAAVTANVGTGSMDQGYLIVGNHGSENRYFNGDIYEIRIYDHALSSAERAQLHSYAQDRYAITVADYTATSAADTTAPTISSFTATPGDGQVALAWAGTDNVGITRWVATRGGTTVYDGTATSFTDTGRTNGTALTYGLTAYDAAGNTKTASASATPAAPASGSGSGGTLRVFDRWSGSTLVRIKHERWTGSALTTRLLERFDAIITPGAGVSVGTSTPARWAIAFGGAPTARATWETGVNTDGRAQVTWVGSMPDARARTSKLETGVLAQAQDAFQAQVIDATTSTVVADSGVTAGAVEKWVATGFTPVPGRLYRGQARVRAADQQWSAYAATRFVAPTGVIRYLEDFGAVGDGVTRSGTDYPNNFGDGPLRQALAACNPGDVVRAKNPGTVVTGVTATGTALTTTTAVFTAAMVGKNVLVYGGGTTDSSSDSWSHRTTITAVASDGKSATLNAAVKTNGTGLTVLAAYPEFWVGHIDVDGGLPSPGRGGGWTLDGTGCVFTSLRTTSSGFRTTIPDVTYRNVHYWQKTQTTRGNGKNGDTGPFFIEGAGAVGLRLIGCYAERSIDAGFLIYNQSSDIHVVDCVADHTNADGFHVTGSAHGVQFIRPLNVWIGDDAVANIGYRSDGDGSRPYDITWESPRVLGQDWGRGVSFGGCYHCLVTDLYIERGAGTSFILGSDGDMANTSDIQIRRATIVAPNLRRGQAPTYSQGSGTGSRIPDEPWLKLLNSSSATQQGPILLEDVTVTDGRYIQIISYGNGAFADAAIVLRGITMTGSTNGGGSWLDQSTYGGHIDLRGITVPSGSTAITAAPSNPNS